MKQSILKLEKSGTNVYRAIFKNRHGRNLYISLKVDGDTCTITDCFYTDRNRGRTGEARYSAKPKLLRTFTFPNDELLNVIATELDKHFYGVEFVQSEQATLSLEEYLQHKLDTAQKNTAF